MNPITQLGLQKLKEHLSTLEKELRQTGEERGEAAREGDLKENSTYIFLGEKAELLRSQIRLAGEDLTKAKVQTAPTQTTSVEFGSQVTIEFAEEKREMVVTIVGKNDTGLQTGWLSKDSPLGMALIGKKANTTTTLNDQTILIKKIEVGKI